jgi:hypothetical protein
MQIWIVYNEEIIELFSQYEDAMMYSKAIAANGFTAVVTASVVDDVLARLEKKHGSTKKKT